MKKKLFCLVLASILCLSLLTGCQLGSRTSSVPEEEGAVTAYAVDYEAMGEEYLTRDFWPDPQYFLKDYNLGANSEKEIEIQYFPDATAMNQQLSTELLSGGGPDLFVFQEVDLPNFYNYANQGIFADLDPYFEKSGYNKSQFQEVVFDYGVVNGTRSFIPLEYGVPMCVTTQNLAEKYGLDKIGEELNYQNYYELLSAIKDIQPEIHWFNELDSFFYRIISAFIDEENKRGQFTSSLFQKSIEEYKEMANSQGGEKAMAIRWETEYIEALVNEELLFHNDPMMSDRQLSYRIGKYWAGQEGKDNPLLLYPVKEYNGEDYYAYVGKMIAINDNSNRKNKAWEVIEKAISTSYQNNIMGGSNPIIGNPVNLEAQDRNKKDWMNSGGAFGKTGKEQLINRYYELLNSVTKCDCLMYNSMYVQEVFDPLYVEYENGTKTLDEFVKELQNKTGLYLKEQN